MTYTRNLVVIVLLGLWHMADHENEKADASGLTKSENAFLRSMIYDHGFSTRTRRTEKGLPQREVALSKGVVELHKNRRVGTLRLLLDITKGARPKDAVKAASTALALEGEAVRAVILAYIDLDSFDKVSKVSNDLPTSRERLVQEVEELLAKAKSEETVRSKANETPKN